MPDNENGWSERQRDAVMRALREAYAVAQASSPDLRTRTAAALFSEEGELLLSAFNAPVAPGLLEKDPSRSASPEKYFWIEHSERALLQAAARKGLATDGKSMGCSLFPCVDCARAIVGTGIKRLMTPAPDFSDPRWGEEFRRSLETLVAGGVEVELIDKAALVEAAEPPALAISARALEPDPADPRICDRLSAQGEGRSGISMAKAVWFDRIGSSINEGARAAGPFTRRVAMSVSHTPPSAQEAVENTRQAFVDALAPRLAHGHQTPMIAVMPPRSGFDSGVALAAGAGARVLQAQIHHHDAVELFGAASATLSGIDAVATLPQLIAEMAQVGAPLVVAISQAENARPDVAEVLSKLARDHAIDPQATLIFQASRASALPPGVLPFCDLVPTSPALDLGDRLAQRRSIVEAPEPGKSLGASRF